MPFGPVPPVNVREILYNTDMKNANGFTLIELLVTVAVVSILLAVGVPEFKRMTENNRMVAAINRMAGDLNLARSEAVKQGRSVTLCASADGATCSGNTDWSNGWIVFLDQNRNGSVDGTDALISRQGALPAGLQLRATQFDDNTIITFLPTGRLLPTLDPDGTFVLCETRNKDPKQARAINLNALGRTSLARDTDNNGVRNDVEGNDVTCP